jgi:hypothetical protein
MRHNLDTVTEWKTVPGHPSFQIGFIDESNVPRTVEHLRYPYPIRRDNGKIVRIEPQYSEKYIKAMIDGKPLNIHRLYLSAAEPTYSKGLVVDHIDRNSHNNLLSNLRWVTPSENNKNQDKRRKYTRCIAHEELPEDCVKLSGTNVLYSITYNDDGTIDEIFLYSPIGKKPLPDYREFDLTLNTVEIDISDSGIFFKYNPLFGKDDDGRRLTVSTLLHRLYVLNKVPTNVYNEIYKRKRDIKKPDTMTRIRNIINRSRYLKGNSHAFIISYKDMCEKENQV